MQGTHGTGKMAKNIPCQGKHREFGNFVKTQGILLAQVVNALILKVKVLLCLPDFFSRSWGRSAKSVLCM